MFTGIVQGLCRVTSISNAAGIQRLAVELADLGQDVADGASIAINGACLTVATHGDNWAQFDVIPETLATTNLGGLRCGTWVNVERSARMSDEVGGHRVSGHVSGKGVVTRIAVHEGDYRLSIRVDVGLMPYLLRKGFVAVNGASLTISAVLIATNEFEICLIPETLTRTTFGTTHAGDELNIEVDATTQAIVDTVRNVLSEPALRTQLLASLGNTPAH